MKRIVAFSAIGIPAVVLVLFSLREPLGKMISTPQALRDASGKEGHLADDSKAKSRMRNPRNASRQKQLAAFIDRWERLPSPAGDSMSDGQPSAEQKALVKEAVGSLLCSEELVELVRFLETQKLPDAKAMVESEVEELMKSDRAHETRASLIQLLETADISDVTVYLPWVLIGGRNCKEAEIVGFCAALKDQGLKLDALGSYNSVLAKTDPLRAITSTLAEYRTRGGSAGIQPILSEQIDRLPKDANFEEIEKLIPAENGTDANTTIRGDLLRKWADQDPAAAANYIMANPDRISENYIGNISNSVLARGSEVAMDWAQSFPEGPYYDNAVAGIVLSIVFKYPDQATQLAERIQNPELRERYLTEVKRLAALPLFERRNQ